MKLLLSFYAAFGLKFIYGIKFDNNRLLSSIGIIYASDFGFEDRDNLFELLENKEI